MGVRVAGEIQLHLQAMLHLLRPQDTLRRIYHTDGITGTEPIMVLETFFERPPDPREPRTQDAEER